MVAGWFMGCGSDTPVSSGEPPTVAPPAPITAGNGGMIPGVSNPPVNPPPAGAGVGTAGTGMPPVVNPPGGPPPVGMPMAGMPGGTPMGGAGAAAPGGTNGGIPPVMGGMEPRVPEHTGECPNLMTGTITVMGQRVQMWAGTKQEGKRGPVFFYWHGTGSQSGEASGGLGGAIQEITGEGGVVASFTTTTGMGMNTGNNVWYTGDFAMADIILACAVKQLNVETKRVYTGGCSAGGLQAGAMVYGRSTYLAGAMPNSGGMVFPGRFEAPGHVPALITTHGAAGVDVVFIDFSETSMTQCKDIAAKGGVAVNCDHGGRHCGSTSAVRAAQWQFLKDHPFGAESPYKGTLPSSFPAFCKFVM
jgi:hypothetical protein